jgi:hypothetical protein
MLLKYLPVKWSGSKVLSQIRRVPTLRERANPPQPIDLYEPKLKEFHISIKHFI